MLDTNALSEWMKSTPHEGLLRFLSAHARECALPAPVWHELWFGCLRLPAGRRRRALVEWLETVQGWMPVLPYDADAARWHATERARLVTKGRTPPAIDGEIASIAATRECVLVTANATDFAAFRGLEVLDWRSPKATLPS
jgi:tRNA(fMet)-specific endonuclease VapC